MTANAKELVFRKVSCRDTLTDQHLRKTQAHQGHCAELLPCRHLQTPDDYARIDGEGNVHEGGDTCIGCLSMRALTYQEVRFPSTYRSRYKNK